MFFKYSYKKYIKDIEAIAYDQDGISLLHDFREDINGPKDFQQFILNHVTLVNSLFLKNFSSIPDEVAKVDSQVHAADLKNLFVKYAPELGFTIEDESDKINLQEYFETSVGSLSSKNIRSANAQDIAEMSGGSYLQNPISKSIYGKAVNHQVLENLKCITKLLKAYGRS